MVESAEFFEQRPSSRLYFGTDEPSTFALNVGETQLAQFDQDFRLSLLDLQVGQQPLTEMDSFRRAGVPSLDGLVVAFPDGTRRVQVSTERLMNPLHHPLMSVGHDHTAVDGSASGCGAGGVTSGDSSLSINEPGHIDQVALIIGDSDYVGFSFPLARQTTETLRAVGLVGSMRPESASALLTAEHDGVAGFEQRRRSATASSSAASDRTVERLPGFDEVKTSEEGTFAPPTGARRVTLVGHRSSPFGVTPPAVHTGAGASSCPNYTTYQIGGH